MVCYLIRMCININCFNYIVGVIVVIRVFRNVKNNKNIFLNKIIVLLYFNICDKNVY